MAIQPTGNFRKLDNILIKKRSALNKLNSSLKKLAKAMQGFKNLFIQIHTN